MKLDHICIVGGGSAGWMTASLLSKHFGTDKQITVVESPNVPTIGVGESTTQFFNTFIWYLGLKDTEWMPACDATYKHSVRFVNFNKNGPFHYPFGPSAQDLPMNDYFNWRRDHDVNSMTFCRTYSDVIDPIESGRLVPEYLDRHIGYHLDAVKFANYLRDCYAVPRGINHIQETVTDIDVSVDGIDRLYLGSDGRFITADLYIDCTGFRALLLNKVHSEWEDWGNVLFNNSTWASRRQYKDRNRELMAYTNCTGLSAGWVWTVPTYSRIGTGYNFSDRHISDADALQEFKAFLGAEDESDENFRLLKWPTGIRKEVWKRNVVGIGLSAGFIEPLESGGLYSVHEFLWKLIQVLPASVKEYNGYMRSAFNQSVKTKFTSFRDFVVKHYVMGNRDDTPFWKDYNQLNELGELSDTLTQDWNAIYKLDQLSEGMAYLLGGYEYDIMPEHYKDLSLRDNFIINDHTIMISEKLKPKNLSSYPRTTEYYDQHLYKGQEE
jgi:flavin-dependent dehydrogenase